MPQRAGAGRPFRYCRDNDGACQRASRNSRMRHRNAPGLPGQVARTWEAVDRLDQMVETLTEALHAELSPAGVQRQLAELRAETAAQVAAAQPNATRPAGDAEDAAAARRPGAAAGAGRDADRDAARVERAERASGPRGRRAGRAAETRPRRRPAAAGAAEALRVQAEATGTPPAPVADGARRTRRPSGSGPPT